MKPRVLQLIGSFNQGGSERQAVALTRLLSRDGTYDVHTATLNDEGPLRPELSDGEVQEYPLTSFFNANFVRQVRRCAAYLRDNKIDIVHTHDFYTNVFGMAAATLGGVSCRVASKRETAGMRSAAQQLVERAAFSRAHAIIANASAVKQHLIDSGIERGKISVIHNGIDVDRFSNLTASPGQFGLPAGDGLRFVTIVANLRHDVKNIPMLLRVAKRIVADRPDVHFVIAGEGELEPELKRFAAELGVDGVVHFIGSCSDIPGLLSLADACVLTSQAEGFSNSILEYMAAGKPVVVTDVGGASEAVAAGNGGYLVASNDDQAMAARVVALLDDMGLAEDMGNNGRTYVVEKFSTDAQLASTLELYGSLLARK